MGRIHVSRPEFKQIKNLTDQGVATEDIVEATGRGRATIHTIAQSSSFADYRWRVAERNNGYRGNGNVLKAKRFLTEKDYRQIKALSEVGLSNVKIGQIVGKHPSTVGRVVNSADWAAYQDYLAKTAADKRARESAETPTLSLEEAQAAVDSVRPEPSSDQALLREVLVANTTALNDLAKAWNGLSEKLGEVLETKRPWITRR